MIIGFDARLMSVPGGIGRYCRELLSELANQNPTDTFVVLVKNIPNDFGQKNIQWIETPIHWYGFAEQFQLGMLMNAQKNVALWHIPHWNVPLLLRKPFVMTLHDFIFEEFPTHENSIFGKIKFKIKWAIWRTLLSINLHRAREIITISNYVKDQILRRDPSCEKKITTIYNGLSHLPPAVRPSHEILQPFFLMVGNSYPHKNYEIVLELYKNYSSAISEHCYIITHKDRFSRKLESKIKELNLNDRIHIMFDAKDPELAWMYENCKTLIFPSKSEGFGIPPLEALSFEKPVVAAETSCLPEILGEHASWFDSENEQSLFNTLNKLDEASPKLISERIAHAKKYSWERAALSTYFLYKKQS